MIDLLISTFSFSHSKRIEDYQFVSSSKNKFQPHITLFTNYITLYAYIIIECKIYYVFFKKRFTKFKTRNLENLIYCISHIL